MQSDTDVKSVFQMEYEFCDCVSEVQFITTFWFHPLYALNICFSPVNSNQTKSNQLNSTPSDPDAEKKLIKKSSISLDSNVKYICSHSSHQLTNHSLSLDSTEQ